MPSCPNCHRDFDKRGIRNHMLICNAGKRFPNVGGYIGTPIETFTQLVFGIIALVVVIIIMKWVCVPFFAFFDKAYQFFANIFGIIDYVANGGESPNMTVAKALVDRY